MGARARLGFSFTAGGLGVSRGRRVSWLLRTAEFVAPQEKAKWLRAMAVERELGGIGEAAAWGWGALQSALIWRARKDGLYAAALVFILLEGQGWLGDALIHPPRSIADTEGLTAFLFDLGWALSWAIPSLFLAALKPRWALMSALTVAFLEPSWLGFLLAVPRSVGGGVRGVQEVLFFALPTLVSSLLGAGAGVLAARMMRRR